MENCLINADYHGLRGVVIRKESDKLILENSGYVRTSKKQVCNGGESDMRNKALMKMFNFIDVGECIRSGVPNIFYVWLTKTVPVKYLRKVEKVCSCL